jgi:hypothetical protein
LSSVAAILFRIGLARRTELAHGGLRKWRLQHPALTSLPYLWLLDFHASRLRRGVGARTSLKPEPQHGGCAVLARQAAAPVALFPNCATGKGRCRTPLHRLGSGPVSNGRAAALSGGSSARQHHQRALTRSPSTTFVLPPTTQVPRTTRRTRPALSARSSSGSIVTAS